MATVRGQWVRGKLSLKEDGYPAIIGTIKEMERFVAPWLRHAPGMALEAADADMAQVLVQWGFTNVEVVEGRTMTEPLTQPMTPLVPRLIMPRDDDPLPTVFADCLPSKPSAQTLDKTSQDQEGGNK